jgi:DNA sulfur modification protein DndE
MIDRIRLTANAKNQLVTLKRKTGIEHYNSLCRHALCLSLANPSELIKETLTFNGGLEIDWRVLTSGYENLYVNILLTVHEMILYDEEEVRELLCSHIHRGLSYMNGLDSERLSDLILGAS